MGGNGTIIFIIGLVIYGIIKSIAQAAANKQQAQKQQELVQRRRQQASGAAQPTMGPGGQSGPGGPGGPGGPASAGAMSGQTLAEQRAAQRRAQLEELRRRRDARQGGPAPTRGSVSASTATTAPSTPGTPGIAGIPGTGGQQSRPVPGASGTFGAPTTPPQPRAPKARRVARPQQTPPPAQRQRPQRGAPPVQRGRPSPPVAEGELKLTIAEERIARKASGIAASAAPELRRDAAATGAIDLGTLDAASMRRAFVLKELLDPPVALRGGGA